MAPSSDGGDVASVVRPFLVSLAATLVFVAIALVAAGRLDVWQAWVYGGISLALNVAQRTILRRDPALAKERASVRADARASDKAVLAIGLLLTVAMLVVAGLQLRYAGPTLGLGAFVVGVAASVGGASLFLWALRENRFFSAIVRVQRDRRQTVCTTGPYRLVRHPGNLGMIVGTMGLPLLFQSTWSFVPAALAVVNLIVRTALEDAALTRELDGYRAYREGTKHRLVPGIW